MPYKNPAAHRHEKRAYDAAYRQAHRPERLVYERAREPVRRPYRAAMAEILGRPLRPREIVHHINQRPKDNRRENLALFPNAGEHRSFHRLTKEIDSALMDSAEAAKDLS